MWNVAGIEPEVLDYRTMTVVHAGYPLRPEIMESAYTLYVKTKDRRYLDMGKTFFDALVRRCRTDAGYTTIKNVVTNEQGDLMPSYFLAETLKYLYLLYAPETLDLEKVVFNTEAHSFRRQASQRTADRRLAYAAFVTLSNNRHPSAEATTSP